MPRLNISIPRGEATKKQYLGKAIFFCEGKTEYNYFEYFKQILHNKFTDIHIELREAEGNAQTVLNEANDFYDNELNRTNYSLYKPYLVFDCDDPKNIQEVINEMRASENDYVLLLNNMLFELWLLMHFEEISEPLRKVQIYKKLADRLRIEKYTKTEKANKGLIRKIIENGEPLVNAIKNAEELEKKYLKKYSIEESIDKMNPYTTMHKVMELILNEIDQ